MADIKTSLLVLLFSSHLIGDFLIQSDKTAQNKKNIFILASHSFLVAFISYIFCGVWNNYLIPLFIFISHLSIDSLKTFVISDQIKEKNNLFVFIVDQFFHLIAIFLFSLSFPQVEQSNLFWLNLWGENILGCLVIFSGFIMTTKFCEIVIGFILAPFLNQLSNAKNKRGFEKGGKAIGILERTIIFIFIFINQPIGIGYLITAKTIFRFGEIRESNNRLEIEYILIGTFLSFALALIMSLFTMILAQQFFHNFLFKLIN